MAGNDSVGKISLDLEIQSDISKQIGAVSGMIGRNLKSSLDGSAKAAFSGMKKNLNSNAKVLGNTLKKALSGAFETAKNIKIPIPKFSKMNFNTPTQADVPKTAQPRAPPIVDVNAGVNAEQLKSQINNLTANLDNINARIEQQQDKLKGLRESYSNTFNPNRKNKIQEEILKTENAINKLIGASDKAGFKLANLDSKLAMLNSTAKGTTAGTAKLDNAVKKVGQATNKASNGFKLFGNSVKNTTHQMHDSHNQFNMMLKSIVTWGLIFPAIVGSIMATGRFLGQAMMANAQFANSLAQVRSNLYTAFMPIYQAVMPAINTLMAGLARVTAYIASFTNALFGKTYKQGFQAAKGLIAAKTAMGVYGDAAKKAGKDTKGALAGFDEINTLNLNKDATGGGGSDKVPEMVAPNIDTSALDKSTGVWAEKFKTVLGTIFQPFKNAWNKNGAGVMVEFKNAIDGTKGTLGGFFAMLGTPPVQTFLENIGSLILVIIKLGLRIYDGFILPMVNWFISILPGAASGLNPILAVITTLVNYLAGDGFVYVQLFLGAVLGLVAGIKTFNIITGIMGLFNGLGTLITTFVIPKLIGLWTVMMANPIALVIGILVSLIATFTTLYTTNENFRNKVNETWSSIKTTFSAFGAWLNSVFSTDWATRFFIFGEVLNSFLANVRNIFGGGVKQTLGGLVDFVAGTFTTNWSRAWNGVKNVFAGIANTFGGIMKTPMNAVIGIINEAINGINKISIDVPAGVPGLGGKHIGFNVTKIPYLARGGIIDSPTLAMVGEAGKEAVMPLENNTGWLDLLADKLVQRLGGLNTGEGNNASTDRAVEIVIQLGGYEFARFVIDSINKLQRQVGETLLEI